MNEDQIKSQIGSAIPTTEDHPLHMLDNQTDPEIKLKKVNVGQKPIRTYESDLADAIRSKNSSIITMAVAENEKKNKEKSVSKKVEKKRAQVSKKSFFLFISLILIVSGLSGGYYLYLKSPLAIVPVVQKQPDIPSIITPDIQKTINIPSLERERLIQFLSSQFKKIKETPDKIVEFIPTNGSSEERISGSSFIGALEFDITDTLKRSLLDKWMIGTFSGYSTETEESIPFIIFTTDFFQNAFAGMLKWESSMPDEMAELFNYKDIANTVDPNSTSTTRISSFYNIKGSFKDKVIMNRDVREFINEDDRVLLLYTFLDKDTLLITTSEEVVPALIKRIEKQTYLR